MNIHVFVENIVALAIFSFACMPLKVNIRCIFEIDELKK